jgi:hypothetical protein
MEQIDFDQLSKKAYHTNAGLEDKDNLWLEVFKLKEWFFIVQEADSEFQLYVSEAKIIEEKTLWLYAFTDFNRATFYTKRNNLSLSDGNSPLSSVAVNEELLPKIEEFIEKGVKGILFNADGPGFYAPIAQLTAIKTHLSEAHSTQL